MMASSPMLRPRIAKGKNKKGEYDYNSPKKSNHRGGNNNNNSNNLPPPNSSSSSGRRLSPLSRSLWGGTSSNNSPQRNPRNNDNPIPSPQRRLFGLDTSGPENIENDKRETTKSPLSTTKWGRRKITKKGSNKDKRDVSPTTTTGNAGNPILSKLFPARISIAERTYATNAARESILLGPRLRSRPSSSNPPPTINDNNNNVTSLGSRNHYASSDDTAYSALPKKGLSIKLAPKNPVQRRSPRRHRPKLSPRKNKDSSAMTSLSKQHLSPMSPLHPPRNLRSNNSNDYFGDFTLTPTVLYNSNNNNNNNTSNGQGGPQQHNYNRRQAPMSATTTTPQYYHQSPHWSGQVRVNPFSPVPEKFLHHPPTSTKSATRGSSNHGRKRHYTGRYAGFYDWDTLDGPPTLPTGEIGEPLLVQPKKRARSRLNPIRSTRARSAVTTAAIPRLDDFEDGISPTDVARKDAFDAETTTSGSKRKTPPRSANSNDWQNDDDDEHHNDANDGNKRMRLPKRGRYLSDFQEVQFLGAGSFGSVNACLSRLDGCMYAVKSVSPAGVRRGGGMGDSSIRHPGTTTEGGESSAAAGGGVDYLYGGRRTMSNQCAIPPTPRRDASMLTPQRRKKAVSRFAADDLDSAEEDCGGDLGVLEGSGHWNDGALRRMLREVFALAALCQQDDFRTFHIVRYQQAWLEDDGTLYIQTELCSATLRDELSGKQDGSANGGGSALKSILHNTTAQSSSAATNTTAMDVFRQIKVLREVLLALELVHQRGMVHLDIKPENIMVKNDLYKLGDFGLANSFTKNEGKAGATNITPDIEEGDSRYMSKDLLDFRPKDLTKCDIFSLGATMYEICTGLPLPACGQEWQDLRNGRLPCPFPSSTMPCLASIVREMMHPDPERRPSATELLAREVLGGSLGGGKAGLDAGNPLLRGPARSTPLYKMGGVAEPVRLNRPSLKRSASF